MKPNIIVSTKHGQTIIGEIIQKTSEKIVVKNAAYVITQQNQGQKLGVMLLSVVLPDFFEDGEVPEIELPLADYQVVEKPVNEAWANNYNQVFNNMKMRMEMSKQQLLQEALARQQQLVNIQENNPSDTISIDDCDSVETQEGKIGGSF